jgi:uncharacterized protein YecT (DUF1311 family)
MDFTSAGRRRWARLALPALAASAAFAVPAVATAAPAHRPGPPLVTEQIGSPLPCNQKSQLGVDGCAEHKLLAADKVLNADITVLWDLLPGAKERQDFAGAQRAWVAYRAKDCNSQSDVYQGGTAQPMEYTLCLASDDNSRRQDLHNFYALLTQGTSKPPRFP